MLCVVFYINILVTKSLSKRPLDIPKIIHIIINLTFKCYRDITASGEFQKHLR